MVLNGTFNNIPIISWRPVLLVEMPQYTDLPQVTDKLYHIMLYRRWWYFENDFFFINFFFKCTHMKMY